MNSGSNSYFQWLCETVDINTELSSYYLLAKHLHRRNFYWTVPNDENRGMDGKQLREEFLAEEGLTSIIAGECTVFEMLIGLARRMNSILNEELDKDRTAEWFWVLMTNCALNNFSDDDFEAMGGKWAFDLIIDGILDRGYRRNGLGGLFPLRHSKKDQRKVEIWYQMSDYILERYYLEDQIV